MRKSKKCPECNSEEVVPIVYGMPDIGLVEKERRGEVQLGGCLIVDNNPKWHCNNCGHEWE